MANKDRLKVEVQIVNNSEKLVRKEIFFVGSGYTCFFNAQHLFLQLSNIERCFFDHLCEIMDVESNRVLIIKPLKEAFISKVSEISNGSVSIELELLLNAVTKLKELGLIIPADAGRSYYIVNPKYVFKGKPTNRKWLLKRLIESRIATGLPVDKLLPMPWAEFLQ